MTDFSLDRIGDRLSGKNLSGQELILAVDDKIRVKWIVDRVDEFPGPILDFGASDGAVSRAIVEAWNTRCWLIERHPNHAAALMEFAREYGAWVATSQSAMSLLPNDFFGVALVCEVLEHYDRDSGELLLKSLRRSARNLIVTVPNVYSATFDRAGRSRWNWPDHKHHYNAQTFADLLGVSLDKIEPIVGTLEDSIWLGAVIDA